MTHCKNPDRGCVYKDEPRLAVLDNRLIFLWQTGSRWKGDSLVAPQSWGAWILQHEPLKWNACEIVSSNSFFRISHNRKQCFVKLRRHFFVLNFSDNLSLTFRKATRKTRINAQLCSLIERVCIAGTHFCGLLCSLTARQVSFEVATVGPLALQGLTQSLTFDLVFPIWL